MHGTGRWAGMMSVLVLVATADAQTIGRDLRSAGALRNVFGGRQAVNKLMLERGPPAPPVTYTLYVGTGYTDGGNGNSVTNLLAELSIDILDGKAVILLDGEYDWVRIPDANSSGWGDPAFTFIYRFNDKGAKNVFAGAASVTVPSGSSVSAGVATQSLALIWNHNVTDNDPLRLTAEADHVNGEVPPGKSAYSYKGKIYYEHDFADDARISDFFLNAEYAYSKGSGNGWVAGGGIDFFILPEPSGPFKYVKGTLSGFCTISPNGRCGHIEFSLELPFR